jgi:molybdopterin molybdotransferase
MAALPEPNLVLSFEEARHLVERHAATLRPRAKDSVDLLESGGLVLAEPITADRNFPPFRRAARDGYAVRSTDVTQLPATLAIVGEIQAGVRAQNIPSLQSGQAALIMTGAPAPEGADAVVMVEYTSRSGERVEISRTIEPGANIVDAGSEGRRGDRLLSPGMRVDHAAIAVAASVGRSHLVIYAKPRVAVLATGDEVVDIDQRPGPTQIRNSNTYSLAAQIRAVGGEPVLLPVAPDEPHRLRELIAEGLESDLLLITGGVSMGKYDFVERVLANLQAEFFFTGVRIQPGKPVVFGKVPCGAATPARGAPQASDTYKYFFGLPGNPVSTMVTFQLFAQPVVEALSGQTPRKLIFLHAQLKSEIATKPGLRRFLPASLSGEFERPEVELARWGGSGDIAATARANCYLVTAPEGGRIAAGASVPVMLR